jgi:hypothetical protein
MNGGNDVYNFVLLVYLQHSGISSTKITKILKTSIEKQVEIRGRSTI